MRSPSDDLAHALAAEYVLGTLRGAARRRFEAMMRREERLRGIVARWEGWITPLASGVPAVDPPARVWRAIEARIQPRAKPQPRAASVAFWRSLGLVSSGLAAVLLAFFAYLYTGPRGEAGPGGEPMMVAVLTSPSTQQPMGVVSMHSPNVLRVRVVRDWPRMRDKTLQLWVMPEQGEPRSLGFVRNEVGDTVMTIAMTDPRVQGAKALAISAEPPGGSKLPTGPVLCSGMIAPMQRT
jgi:anti-sigma-K factor RskA